MRIAVQCGPSCMSDDGRLIEGNIHIDQGTTTAATLDMNLCVRSHARPDYDNTNKY